MDPIIFNHNIDKYYLADLAMFSKMLVQHLPKTDTRRQLIEEDITTLEQLIASPHPSLSAIQECIMGLDELLGDAARIPCMISDTMH